MDKIWLCYIKQNFILIYKNLLINHMAYVEVAFSKMKETNVYFNGFDRDYIECQWHPLIHHLYL